MGDLFLFDCFCAVRQQWEDEYLVAMVLSKISTALGAPGRMDLPTVQVGAR